MVNSVTTKLHRLMEAVNVEAPVRTESEECRCPKCGARATLFVSCYADGRRSESVHCTQCELESLAAERRARSARVQALEVMSQIKDVVPASLLDASFSNFVAQEPSEKAALITLKALSDKVARGDDEGSLVLVSGSFGVGKTHLGVAAVKAVLHAGKTGFYVPAVTLGWQMKDAWKGEGGRDALLRKYVSYDFLVIDEVGVASSGDAFVHDYVSEVALRRYEEKRSTVLISNFRLQDLEAFLDPRLLDRLRDQKRSRILSVIGKSRRSGTVYEAR
ncbi:ATP-binding protein [Candidatus Parcubacteria bacterium]|nr:MAG: ATP-binding protein [Candidatus Parcubacteria bacterium]